MEEWNRREARDDLLRETRKQVKKESKMLEKTKSALMREINTGANEIRLIAMRLQEITGTLTEEQCNWCISEVKGFMRQWSRLGSPKMETRIREG